MRVGAEAKLIQEAWAKVTALPAVLFKAIKLPPCPNQKLSPLRLRIRRVPALRLDEPHQTAGKHGLLNYRGRVGVADSSMGQGILEHADGTGEEVGHSILLGLGKV